MTRRALTLLAAATGGSAAVWPAAPPGGGSGLNLTVYNSSALAGALLSTKLVSGLSFQIPIPAGGAVSLSAEVIGTLHTTPGSSYSFNCSFGGAQFASLHVDGHLVCQHGANADAVLTPGQGSKSGCGGGSDHGPCNGVDNPFPTMRRTELAVRLAVQYNPALLPAGTAPPPALAVVVSHSPAALSFAPALPPLEQRRREMQQSLLQGWGLFYDMSYLDAVLLPAGARLKLALCQTAGSGGKCLTNARMDWPDKTGLA